MIRRNILLVLSLVFTVAASPSLWAAQFARSDATANAAGWTVVNAATHHEALDEIAADDNDYIDSGNNNSSTVILGLSNATDPGGTNLNDHILRYRCLSAGGGGQPESCNAALYEGATLIFDTGNNSANRGAFALYEFTIADASAITDYTNLSIQLTSVVGNNESIQISWVELEVPNPAVTAPTVAAPTFADVTDTTVTLGGNVTADNGTAVTDRGVEWGTASGGPYPNSVAQGTGGTGLFTVPVTGLSSSTIIYFRAWATNGGTGYSAESSFTTTAPAAPPTVDTPSFASVTANSAVLGGNVSADGGATVTDRGIVWNTTSPAETGGTLVPMGSGLGTFSQLVSSLPAGTLIYFKAYGINTAGTSYSAETSFTTLVGLPTVDTPTVASITATAAILGGTVSSDGGDTVTRGTVWGTSPNPTGNILSQGSGTGTFSHLRSTLPTGTLVYFRAYATNSAGTAYSADATFTPSSPPVVNSPTAASITHNSAVLGGTITSDGGNPILERGTVWNTSGTPVIENTLAEGGKTTGVFSHIRSLPSSSTIFYRAYATSVVGTSYSAEGSFTTGSEPTVQASNITFPRVSGKSMRISWTRGNGDGSIVVLRLQATTKTDPPDGNDYAANADYTLAPELPVSSQNFVVHKGAGSFILVTGLSLSTTYSVAIYEYAGTGASTDYLLLTPAEATQATTAVPVHNEDNRADCSDCHSHGSWFVRDVELKVVCSQCHNSSGTAAAKLEFNNHLAPGKNPDVEFVDCGLCHEMHNPGGTNTTESLHSLDLVTRVNKSFLRANVDKYVSTAVTPAYLHTDQPLREGLHPDAPQAAITPDRAVEGGDDTTARGYCQVCHTLTNNHRSTNTAGSDQSHDGLTNISGWGTETNCGECHQHNNSFIGSGGTASCVTCHDSQQGGIPRPIITTQFDRLSSHIKGGSGVVTQEDCLVCHDQSTHQTQTVRLLDVDDGVTSFAQLTAGAPTTATGEGEQFEGNCMSCHDDGVAASLPASGSDQTQTSPFTGSGAPPIIDPTAWSNAAHNRPSATFPASPVTCIGDGVNGCHGSGHGSEQNTLWAPAIGPTISTTDFCYVCHDADGPSSHNIQAQFNTITNYQTTSASGALVNQRHDIIAADQGYSGGVVSCKDCHSPHANNASNPVNNPDTGAPLPNYDFNNASYNPGGHLDPLNPAGSAFPAGTFTESDNIEFCLVCHDGAPPTGVTLSANLTDIASFWLAGEQHGRADGNGSGNGFLKPPFNTGTGEPPNYAALNCTTCHGAHGSENIFNLKTSINIAGVDMTVGGWLGDTIGEDPLNPGSPRVGQTEYLLPSAILPGNAQNDHNWGAWCSFCHQIESHGKDETTNCTSGHMHGGKQF